MQTNSRMQRWNLFAVGILFVTLVLVGPAAAAPQPTPAKGRQSLQAAFTHAAHEFGVPEQVLLAVSYDLSRWDTHNSAPSFAGGYGPMHLIHVDGIPTSDDKGDDAQHTHLSLPSRASLHTLDAAATLLGISPDVLKRDPVQNIRGGAALLAQYATTANGTLPTDLADWYSAVAAYSQASDTATANSFADDVYSIIQQGQARTTDAGEQVTLAAAAITPHRPSSAARTSKPQQAGIDCPNALNCEFVPAAYVINNPADLTDYGNYDLANRPADGLDVRYIVIHDTEVDYNTTLQIFQDPFNYVSSNYVIRSSDGHIAQMVATQNVAWHAGNWYVNGHAIGIEHEGFAIAGATWYTESMYRASARLVRYLAHRYRIPLDRAHIVGHDDIPGPTPGTQPGMHWDPGPFWDWAHYMQLLGHPIEREAEQEPQSIITIAPDFNSNHPNLTYCYGANDCRDVSPQPSNFVYLYSAPDLNAPLISNPYIGSDPSRANNWANKAVTGQTFYRFARQGDWDGIYFSGQQAWYYNPNNTKAVEGTGILITPKPGVASIPVYGRAYPEASAYPADVFPQAVRTIDQYSIPSGQIYVAVGPFTSDYYSAPTFAPTLAGSDHQVITGQTKYYQIFYNHRFAFVMANDVDVVRQ